MNWMDIASIVFICTTAIHLELVDAVTTVLLGERRKLPIISCPKCLTWWCSMIYGIIKLTTYYASYDVVDFIYLLAVSFLASYLAIWLELFEGFIDSLYMKLYEKIYSTSDTDTAAADGYKSDTDCTVS